MIFDMLKLEKQEIEDLWRYVEKIWGEIANNASDAC